MPNKRQKYIIKITFAKAYAECSIGTRQSGYLYSGARKDTFLFQNKSVTIEAERSNVYTDGTILSSDRNGLYGQILKALVVFYALAPEFPKVSGLSIIRKRNAPYGDYVYTETNNFGQPVNYIIQRNLHFRNANIDEVLEETERGKAVRIAMTYWLKAINSEDRYFKFDRFWKAYDRLLLYQGDTTKQIEGIPAIKTLIAQNEGLFTRSKAHTNTYDYDYLRSFSWNHLIYRTSFSYQRPREIIRRATEYRDHRAVMLFKNIVSGEKIRNALGVNEYANVNTHFNANATTVNDIDLVLLMSLSYTYYVRNQLFHGVIPDSTFKLQATNEDREIDELNKLLELVIFELLDNNHIFRV